MRLRDLSKTTGPNDGTRTLIESTLVPQVVAALKQWTRHNTNAVLIGGLALSYYVKPRTTQDIDFLFSTDGDIPAAVKGFKRSRAHAFVHKASGVEVELITPSFINVPASVVAEVISTTVLSDGVKVASPSGLVALKLFRLSLMDKADIGALSKTGTIDLAKFGLPQHLLDRYADLAHEAAGE